MITNKNIHLSPTSWIATVKKKNPKNVSTPTVKLLPKSVKGYQYGYQLKGLDLGVKNMWFVYRFSCLFTFYEYKQLNVNKSQ